ncbi:MAG: hypothetical protein A2173_10655 [Planctomycetes bacterium RBG_13_44_8b]|nr:MAG: hypothetical protein A2173_10655 [Planctomycetes bacterium RBG_13_44_8b]
MKKKYLLVFIIIAACLAFYFWPRQKGYIEIDSSGIPATLRLHHGLFSRTIASSNKKPSTVKVGFYSPKWLQLRGQKGDDTWRIVSSGPWGKLEQIGVGKGETTFLRLGPPLIVKTNVTKRDSQVSIYFTLTGRVGERYANIITKNGQRAPAPEVKIIDEGGKVLAAGRFQYG